MCEVRKRRQRMSERMIRQRIILAKLRPRNPTNDSKCSMLFLPAVMILRMSIWTRVFWIYNVFHFPFCKPIVYKKNQSIALIKNLNLFTPALLRSLLLPHQLIFLNSPLYMCTVCLISFEDCKLQKEKVLIILNKLSIRSNYHDIIMDDPSTFPWPMRSLFSVTAFWIESV